MTRKTITHEQAQREYDEACRRLLAARDQYEQNPLDRAVSQAVAAAQMVVAQAFKALRKAR